MKEILIWTVFVLVLVSAFAVSHAGHFLIAYILLFVDMVILLTMETKRAHRNNWKINKG